ncbi:MAG: amino acid ABC transporter ATP-binding protein [Clostridiaceae bacterium]
MKLKIKNLTKSFGDNVILDNVNLELNNVHSLVIIGPSGGGKSTLLRIIAGLEKPDSGEIWVNEKKLNFDEEYLINYRKNVGMVFQSYNLFPHLTAIKNITLPLEKVHKLSEEEAIKRAKFYLEKFQLNEHMDKKPIQLSGGQQQRVAIARALSINPDFLLLDEPTSALDPDLTKEVLDTILELKEEKRDMMLVTHEMGFAKQASDYIIFVANGGILEEGHSTQVFSNPKTDELNKFLERILEWR